MLSINEYIPKIVPCQYFDENYNKLVGQYRAERHSKKLHVPIECNELSTDARLVYEEFTAGELDIIDVVVWGCHRYYAYFASQERIGQLAGGYERSTVNRAIKKACEYGLIAKIQREYDTCVYKASNFFTKEKNRSILAKAFRISRVIPFMLLYSSNAHSISEVTLSNRSIYISNQVSICKGIMPTLPSGIYPTRVEMVASWKPIKNVLPADQSELFRDTRLKRNSSVSGGYKNQKAVDEGGSQKSDRAWQKENATTEFLRREAIHKQKLIDDEKKLALLTDQQVNEGMAIRLNACSITGAISAQRFYNDVQKARVKIGKLF